MKHAFLIMAHGNWELLQKLIKKLDHQNNDIYIHIDKKISFPSSEKSKLLACVGKSHLYFEERMRINWGGYTQIECELRLFSAAYEKRKYQYYHIMSGVDFPIKSMDYIHRFFETNAGYEFVDDEPDEWTEGTVWQFRYYHLLQEMVGRKNSRKFPSFFCGILFIKNSGKAWNRPKEKESNSLVQTRS